MATTRAWTDARRRIVAKTLFDILKIAVAATFASKFFAEFTTAVKVAMVGSTLIIAFTAFVIYPKEGD